MPIKQLPSKEQTKCLYSRCIMTKPFFACHKCDLDHVFKNTTLIESFHIWSFWNWHKLSALVWNLKLLKLAQTVSFGLEDDHHECRHPICINQISLTSVKVTGAIDILNGNEWHAPSYSNPLNLIATTITKLDIWTFVVLFHYCILLFSGDKVYYMHLAQSQ